MKKNIGISDRLVRFVLMDLLLGLSYLGMEIPPQILGISFIVSLYLIFTFIIGYSPLYHLFGIKTIQVAS